VLLSEAEIEIAVVELANIGIYVEPTSAQAAAALLKLVETGEIGMGESVVLVLTGTGLKATARIAEILGVPS
jgi:threonine synthase